MTNEEGQNFFDQLGKGQSNEEPTSFTVKQESHLPTANIGKAPGIVRAVPAKKKKGTIPTNMFD